MNKVNFINISKNIKLEMDDNIQKMIEDELHELLSELENLRALNLQNLLPMNHMDDEPIEFNDLRDDIVIDVNIKENVLNNSQNHDDDFICIKQVVK